jgi:hypothetical protein
MRGNHERSDSDRGEIGVKQWKLVFSDVDASFFPPLRANGYRTEAE